MAVALGLALTTAGSELRPSPYAAYRLLSTVYHLALTFVSYFGTIGRA